MMRSQPLAFAAEMVSKTTAAGSDPSFCLIIGTPARSLHTSSCSIAAARKVSAAPRMTLLPSFLYLSAILPMVVVLPAPLTPIMTIIEGFVSVLMFCPSASIPVMISLSIPLISSGFSVRAALTLALSSVHIFSAVETEISDIISISSSSSKSSSSILVKTESIPSRAEEREFFVFLSPSAILLKNPISCYIPFLQA